MNGIFMNLAMIICGCIEYTTVIFFHIQLHIYVCYVFNDIFFFFWVSKHQKIGLGWSIASHVYHAIQFCHHSCDVGILIFVFTSNTYIYALNPKYTSFPLTFFYSFFFKSFFFCCATVCHLNIFNTWLFFLFACSFVVVLRCMRVHTINLRRQ